MTQRSLADWLSYLEQLHPTAIDMGLERSREVARRLGLGRPAKRVVTVTGTNGKGSTCALLAELLREQGLSVGVYSSPHLLRYNERVRIDGVEAGDAQLCDAFSPVEAARGEISLTYFEMALWAAFWLLSSAPAGLRGAGSRPWRAPGCVNLIDAEPGADHQHRLDHGGLAGRLPRKRGFREKPVSLRAAPGPVRPISSPRTPLLEQVARWAPLLPARLALRLSALAIMAGHWRGAGRDRASALALRTILPFARACPWKTPRSARGLAVAFGVALAGGSRLGRGAARTPG
ncbi:hypothetical protein [Pseudomonas aeruginosa]|uniref:hypothetical protein n=1 Tax=Pseudomonas aeruginosa TaxID=287 RepID=UPI0039C89D71